VASLLAAGYTLAENALEKAKEVDERNNFSARAKVVVDSMVVKAQQVDAQYHISEKANAAVAYVNDTAHKLNDQYGITEKGAAAIATVAAVASVGIEAAKDGIQKAQENPTIKKGVDTVKTTAQNVQSAVTEKVTEITNQTRHEIDSRNPSSSTEKPTGVDMQQ